MENRQSLPEYLKHLRKLRGYKQKDIASWLHISRQTYSHYETGRIKPSVTVLYNIAQVYGISVDSILKRMGIAETDSKEEETAGQDTLLESENFSEQQFFANLYGLSEKNRKDVFSIMWGIVQAKKRQEETDIH